MNGLLITVALLSFTLCQGIWNYGYTIGNTGAYTVMKPTFTGVRPEYVIVKPSHNSLRAGVSAFKPNYNGMKAEYKPDYLSKPSYSGLRPGLNPTYFTDRREKQLKPMAKKYNPNLAEKKDYKPIKNNNKVSKLAVRPQFMENSKIYVKQLDGHNGKVVKTYQVDTFDQIAR